jgi:hypothetical protein
MRTVFLLVTFCFAALAGPALADCTWNGKRVPEGTRNGAFVCQDGQWIAG